MNEAFAVEYNPEYNSFLAMKLLDSWKHIQLDNIEYSEKVIEESEKVIEEMKEIRKYFSVAKVGNDTRVLVPLYIIDHLRSIATTDIQKRELNNMFELIIKSKYNRNSYDSNMSVYDRISRFQETYRIELVILYYLNDLLGSETREFKFNDD